MCVCMYVCINECIQYMYVCIGVFMEGWEGCGVGGQISREEVGSQESRG